MAQFEHMRNFASREGEVMSECLKHIHLDGPLMAQALEPDCENPICQITRKIHAEVLDMTDKTIVEAIISTARGHGITDLYLIDKEFIMTAIKNEMARRQGG
jgi:hypothetical protein